MRYLVCVFASMLCCILSVSVNGLLAGWLAGWFVVVGCTKQSIQASDLTVIRLRMIAELYY